MNSFSGVPRKKVLIALGIVAFVFILAGASIYGNLIKTVVAPYPDPYLYLRYTPTPVPTQIVAVGVMPPNVVPPNLPPLPNPSCPISAAERASLVRQIANVSRTITNLNTAYDEADTRLAEIAEEIRVIEYRINVIVNTSPFDEDSLKLAQSEKANLSFEWMGLTGFQTRLTNILFNELTPLLNGLITRRDRCPNIYL